MEELFTTYSLGDIVIFVIILALAVKELITFIDWAGERIGQIYEKNSQSTEEKRKLNEEIEKLSTLFGERDRIDETFRKIDEKFEKINEQIEMMIESDKEDIKSYIVREHHYFVYTLGWIDDYSLECLERRFAIYEREHGNTFVKGLMEEVRTLPKQPPEDMKDKYTETAEFIRRSEEERR